MSGLFDSQPALLVKAIAHLNDIVLITEAEPIDAPGPRIVFVNDAFEARTGYRREEVIGQSPRILQGAGTQRSELDRIRTALARWEPVRAELVNYTKSGEAFWLELEIVPVADETGWYTHWIAIQRDVTERKLIDAARMAMEAELRELQKLEAIGTLAGGIAHDFNNIIATMLGNAALIDQDMDSAHASRESVIEIQKAGRRGRELVQQILSFSRRQPTTLQAVQLRAQIAEAIRLLRLTIHSSIDVRSAGDEALPPIQADPTQILQILMNLGNNALQAMRGRDGQLVFAAHVLSRAPADGRDAPVVRLTVSDNGVGMDEQTRAHVFEPFFTTKPPGEGTGLGLSVVYGIVQAHGASISVSSAINSGTRFTIDFPVLADAEATGIQSPATGQAAHTPAETAGSRILYLDDDESMGYLVKRMLQRDGHVVRSCALQAEAIEAVRSDPQGFDLLITDFNMPGMNGIQVVREWRALTPGLKVAIASGFFDDALLELAREHRIENLIVKERDIEDFCQLIRKLLAQPLQPTA